MGGLPRTAGRVPSGRRFFALLCSVGLAAIALAVPTGTFWLMPAMLLLPLAGAWVIWRESLIGAICLAQLAVYYGLTWLVLQTERPPELVALVILWCAGVMIGCLVGRPPRSAANSRVWRPPTGLQFGLAVAMLAAQVVLIRSGQLGYEAQITGGQSTPTGLLGTAATTAPVMMLMVLISALSSGQRVVPACALAIAESIVLSLSGFRGAGVLFLISAVYVAALMLPNNSQWRQFRRLLLTVPAVVVLVVVAFTIAAQVKSTAAANFGHSSRGNQLFGAGDAINALATRLDFGDPLERGIAARDSYALQQAVLWSSQLQSAIPRLLWPSKPINNYGQQVTAAIYGLHNSKSSATITVIGDSLVNFGRLGVLVGGLLLGSLIRLLERLVRIGRSWPSLVLAACLSYAILSGEVSLIGFLITLLRLFAVLAVVWGSTELIANVRRRQSPAVTGQSIRLDRLPSATTYRVKPKSSSNIVRGERQR